MIFGLSTKCAVKLHTNSKIYWLGSSSGSSMPI